MARTRKSSSRSSRSSSSGSSRGSSSRGSSSRSNSSWISRLTQVEWLGIGIGAVLAGGLVAMLLRPEKAHAPSIASYKRTDPPHDRFGNTGDENMVEPLTHLEDEMLMRDRLNPHPGLL